jgi:uncharacterized glyoxalase superfamily protein PhnB
MSPTPMYGHYCNPRYVQRILTAVFARAVGAGASPLAPVADEHGWRLGRIVDPFGHEWEIGRPIVG